MTLNPYEPPRTESRPRDVAPPRPLRNDSLPMNLYDRLMVVLLVLALLFVVGFLIAVIVFLATYPR